jgi:hypothetical protein
LVARTACPALQKQRHDQSDQRTHPVKATA